MKYISLRRISRRLQMIMWAQESHHHQAMQIKAERCLTREEKVKGREVLAFIINFKSHRLQVARQEDQVLDRFRPSPTRLQRMVEQLQQPRHHICKPRAPGRRRRARLLKTKKNSSKRKLNNGKTFRTPEASRPWAIQARRSRTSIARQGRG